MGAVLKNIDALSEKEKRAAFVEQIGADGDTLLDAIFTSDWGELAPPRPGGVLSCQCRKSRLASYQQWDKRQDGTQSIGCTMHKD